MKVIEYTKDTPEKVSVEVIFQKKMQNGICSWHNAPTHELSFLLIVAKMRVCLVKKAKPFNKLPFLLKQ